MSNDETPVFPFQESQHYSNYGFDPQLDYFQVLEEAKKHKRDTSLTHFSSSSKDVSSKKIKKNKKRWWKNAFLFFKKKWPEQPAVNSSHRKTGLLNHNRNGGVFRGSMSGPLYITESRSGSSVPYSTASRSSSGPLAGILNTAELQIPYISLREINMEQHHTTSTKSTSTTPIYLVT